jgi:hypothetical protein
MSLVAMIKASNGVFSAMICGGTAVNVQKLRFTGKLSYAEMQSRIMRGTRSYTWSDWRLEGWAVFDGWAVL